MSLSTPTAPVRLSERAAHHVSVTLARRGKGLGLRLGVKTSGCSGMAYRLEFADVCGDDDVRFESHGVTVLIDRLSLPYLAGTQLDYVREGLNEGFRFDNPNAASRCGCGESFTV